MGSEQEESTSAQPQLEQATNLLDVVLERVAKGGKSSIIARAVLVTRLGKGREVSDETQRGAYQRLIDRHSTGDGGEVTGLLLVYPVCSLCVIEAKTSTLMSMLQDIVSSMAGSLRLPESRVVACTEDIPSRLFNAWYCSYVPSASSAESMDPLDSASAVKTASDVNAFLRKVGPTLIAPNDAESVRRLASLDAYYDAVPALDSLLALCPTEDAPSLEEFLDIFDGPINVDLESEQVWPMAPPLQF